MGHRNFLFNPFPYRDCIDTARSKGRRGRRGELIDITKYEFVPERLPPSPIFVAASDWVHVFSIEGRDERSLGLESMVEMCALRGFAFREVWNDQDPGNRPEYHQVEQ